MPSRDRASIALALALPLLGLAACTRAPRNDASLPTMRPVQPIVSPAPSPADARMAGLWREFWGIPGETDVTYNDEYLIKLDDQRILVIPQSSDHQDTIISVAIDGDDLDLVLHTTFHVHYRLHLDPDGRTLRGTAETPSKTFPIRWERIGVSEDPDCPPAGCSDSHLD
jgi:hypothetical protein